VQFTEAGRVFEQAMLSVIPEARKTQARSVAALCASSTLAPDAGLHSLFPRNSMHTSQSTCASVNDE
jgi:hypothetical protein